MMMNYLRWFKIVRIHPPKLSIARFGVDASVSQVSWET